MRKALAEYDAKRKANRKADEAHKIMERKERRVELEDSSAISTECIKSRASPWLIRVDDRVFEQM